MDSVSGSLRDSDPTSPMSPQSPSSPLPFTHPKIQSNQLAIPSQLHDALLTSLQGKRTKSIPSLGVQTPVYDTDALITAELVLVNTPEEDLAMLSVQFNNLDVIGMRNTFPFSYSISLLIGATYTNFVFVLNSESRNYH